MLSGAPAKFKSKRPAAGIITTRKPASEQAILLDYYEALYHMIYSAITDHQDKAKKNSERTVINNLLTIANTDILISKKLTAMIAEATMHMVFAREAVESCCLFKRKVPLTQLDNICQLIAGFELRNLNENTLVEFKLALDKVASVRANRLSTVLPLDDQVIRPVRVW